MIDQARNVLRIPELRKRLIFTAMLVFVYRVGAFIPVPGVDPGALHLYMEELTGGVAGSALDFVDMFTGGALSNMAIFAMGIMPYVSASIILQLLTVMVPQLERMSKEGEVGRRKINRYTRYLTGVLGAIQAGAISAVLASQQTASGLDLVPNPSTFWYINTVLTLTTGTVFVMWLGERISERGLGNGISLLICIGIIAQFPVGVMQTAAKVKDSTISPLEVAMLILMMVAIIAFIIFVERAQRRIPVQYAKRVIGNKVRAGQSTHLPLKLNTSGVIPVIFAQSVIILPGILLQYLPTDLGWANTLRAQLGYAMPLYVALEVGLIVFFCFFYTSIVFNPVDVTDNMKKHGGFVPGIRPGKKTAEYIDDVLSKVTLWGALYLSAVSVVPMFITDGVRLHELPGFLGGGLFEAMPQWFKVGLELPMSARSFFGGTSLLIVVGVSMDFMSQIESQLIMRNYEGFLRTGRLRGRRG